MRNIALLMNAKGNSKRLPNKNKLNFRGKPMFCWNLEKGIQISNNFYFNSNDNEMIQIAKKLKAKIIVREKHLLGHEVPSRILFKSCLKFMPKNIDGILSIQANSPNIKPTLIKTAFEIMKKTDVEELITLYKNYDLNVSLWGATRKKIRQYNNNLEISDDDILNPDCILIDESIDIHTKQDFLLSQKIFIEKRKY